MPSRCTLRNVGTVKGTDPLGREVKATDDAVVTQVLGEVLSAELPRTGSSPRIPLRAGIGMVLAGMVMVLAARTRRRMA